MLFRRVQEGCWEAFDVLFHTYAEQLFFYAMGFVNNREEARDIVQGTFITVDIRDGCGGGVGNRRMVIDPGSGKRTGGCGRRKNGRG